MRMQLILRDLIDKPFENELHGIHELIEEARDKDDSAGRSRKELVMT